MTAVVIPTSRLNLVLQTPDEALAWVESLPPSDRAEVSAEWIARVRATQAGDPWSLCFKAVDRASGITPENVAEYLPHADCFLVATGISRSFTELDPVRVQDLVQRVAAFKAQQA